jgi:hypothetical protein
VRSCGLIYTHCLKTNAIVRKLLIYCSECCLLRGFDAVHTTNCRGVALNAILAGLACGHAWADSMCAAACTQGPTRPARLQLLGLLKLQQQGGSSQ